jgi:hypothetical protein
MSEISISGYGASIDYDGATIRIRGGKAQSSIWRTTSVTIPVRDIVEMDYRPATLLVTGSLRFRATQAANDYADPREDGAPTTVPNNGLVVHWRRKDQAAFDGLRVALEQVTTKNAPADS